MDSQNKKPEKKAPQILELGPAQLAMVSGGDGGPIVVNPLPIFEMGRCRPHFAVDLPIPPVLPPALLPKK